MFIHVSTFKDAKDLSGLVFVTNLEDNTTDGSSCFSSGR